MARILVVDDEKEVVYIIRFVLEKAGYTVWTAGNGVEALAVLGIDPPNPDAAVPDLVFLDVMMPVMDGHTASVRMRDDKRTAGLPIIVETAYGDMLHLFEGAPNVVGFLQKPFNPRQINEQVEKVLSRTKPRAITP
ncbi:MAG: response regulator [Elusimicrobia bacterium]|nr:response regulator [Elusimicrobiota bacterium]